MKVQEIRKD